ncbi:pimeloyl-ACP methyl ester carboxylesterase [Nitrobacteraceae bacterium AZCC 1564]
MSDSLPVVLVPGLACSPRVFVSQLPALWQHGPVTVASPLRDNTMEGIAKHILDGAPPRFALAGHSMGGYVCLEIWRQAPERVARLALLNTYSRPDPSEAVEHRRGWIAEVKQGGYRAVLERLFADAVHPKLVNDAALRQLILDMGNEVGPDAFMRQVEAIMTRADARRLLASITCPTLVLTSDTDRSVPNQASFAMADAIPGAKLVTIPECGHLPSLEKPEALTTALLDWLAM